MNDELRRKVVVRKAIYLGLIVGLFFLSMFWRGVFALPVGDANYITKRDPQTDKPVEPTALDKFARLPIRQQAEDLEMRELDLGDPDVESAVFQVSLVGSRGVAVTLFWHGAINAQKRGEYQLMQFYSKVLTRLQPHFIEPWIFQAWNVSYNVSVETDKLGDAYYYIASGIGMLAEGDRINTRTHRRKGESYIVGSPDIRYQLAFFVQNKFTVADKVKTFLCLSDLSYIPPSERDPKNLTVDGTDAGRVDPAKFAAFCEKYPQLVRRLRTSLKYETREQVVDFLAVNRELPSRYELNGEPRSDERAFPIFPQPEGNDRLKSTIRALLEQPGDSLDILHSARSWYDHAQDVVPPPQFKPDAVPTDFDQFRYRLPARPALIVFRSTPARAQTYLAERLQKEGWFDANTAWDPDANVDAKNAWFAATGKPAALKSRRNAAEEWRVTYGMWDDYGRRNGLNESDRVAQENIVAETDSRLQRANIFLDPTAISDPILKKAAQDNFNARQALQYYDQNRQITNYQFFLDQSKFEMTPATAEVRLLLWNADELHSQNRLDEEIATRTIATAKWRAVVASPEHRKFFMGNERSDSLQEQALEMEVSLTKLLEKDTTVKRGIERAKGQLLLLGPAFAAVPEPALARLAAEDEALSRIALAYPSEDLARRAKQLIDDIKAKYPTITVSDEATRRELIDGEFAWMKLHTDPTKAEHWIKPYIRLQYLQKIGALPEPAPYSGGGTNPESVQPGKRDE